MQQQNDWNIEVAKQFFNVSVWSEGYFDINHAGNVQAIVGEGRSIDFTQIMQQLKQQQLSLPVLLRFPQILRARVNEVSKAFHTAIQQHDYEAKHVPLYPIKVNQQRTVIEHILASNQVGLEVGSKTELLAALSLLDPKEGLLVCNGYKDRAYIRLALLAQQLGIKVFIVVEKLSELELIEQESTNFKVTPCLGVRVRLHSIAAGNWQNTGGRNAKFGLNANDLVMLMQQLQAKQQASWLSMLHFHMGSQISRLADFESGLNEAMRIFASLVSAGFAIRYLDVGGGLAVDYAAQQDCGYFSKEYSIKEYAQTVVACVAKYCAEQQLPMPNLFTENGRALTAHHAVLVTNVVESEQLKMAEVSPDMLHRFTGESQQLAQQILNLCNVQQAECIEKLSEFTDSIHNQFLVGKINLQQRAEFEQLVQYVHTTYVNKQSDPTKYYCNFSMFRSMPDVWGIQQIFPILPLSKLHEEPTQKVRLHDLTCDSDGQIAKYANQSSVSDAIYLHQFQANQEYQVGFFLVGAYQEVLGDIHNLFGDTHAVNVELDAAGNIIFSEVEIGDCVHELLATVHVDGQKIIDHCRHILQFDRDSSGVDDTMLAELEDALYSYTYLDSLDRNMHRIKGQ